MKHHRSGASPFADGSFSGQRMQSAGIRAIDDCLSFKRKAARLIAEMDEVTSPHGIPIAELSDEDSMVVLVDDARRIVS